MNLGYEVSLGGIPSSRVNAYARNRPDIPYPERDIEEKNDSRKRRRAAYRQWKEKRE